MIFQWGHLVHLVHSGKCKCTSVSLSCFCCWQHFLCLCRCIGKFCFCYSLWFVSVWCGDLWEFYFWWCVCWNRRVVSRLGVGWENFSQCFMWRVNACTCINKSEFDLEWIALKWCCSFCLMPHMYSFCLNLVELIRFNMLSRKPGSFGKCTWDCECWWLVNS